MRVVRRTYRLPILTSEIASDGEVATSPVDGELYSEL